LTERVIGLMRSRYARVTIEGDVANGRLVAYVRKYGQVLGQEFEDGRMRLDVRLPTAEVPRVIGLGGIVVQGRSNP
jgi:hypothetical protein